MEQQRQKSQLAFVDSGDNIEIGTLNGIPITKEQLKATTEESDYVVETFNSGLTAMVFRLKLGDQCWTLKKKRAVSLVKNVDGQTSFLNEVQRRRDLTVLKQQYPESFGNIVNTQYASYTEGIILSPWIEGDLLINLERDSFQQIFFTIVNLELSGLFEWDYCSGNILIDSQGKIKLFDFGYMYQFDPLKDFNSNGQDVPIFHGVERFETRFFFDYLLKNPLNLSSHALFELYRIEKQCALDAYQYKLTKLIELGADESVLTRQQSINSRWRQALADETALQELYLLESYRSNVLDLLDDLHGKSCSPITIKKADLVLSLIENYFEPLQAGNAFFFGDEELDKNELMTKYRKLCKDAKCYQLDNVTVI